MTVKHDMADYIQLGDREDKNQQRKRFEIIGKPQLVVTVEQLGKQHNPAAKRLFVQPAVDYSAPRKPLHFESSRVCHEISATIKSNFF